MHPPGTAFTLPDGSRYVLRTSGDEVDGEFVEFEWIFEPGTLGPPMHSHPSQVEEYEVLEGELEVVVDGRTQTLTAGQSASVPAGVAHTFRRPRAFTRVRNFHRPALGFEDFIATMARLAEERNIRRSFDPRVPLVLASAWQRHPETLYATRPHERLALRGAAAIARATGFR